MQRTDIYKLCEADATVLDAIIANRAAADAAGDGGDGASGPMPPGSAQRAARLGVWLSLLDHLPLEDEAPEPGLTDRAMQRIERERHRLRFAHQIESLRQPRRGGGFSWRQVAGLAAVLVAGFSLLMPAVERGRAQAARVGCADNLAVAGSAFGAFAKDHGGILPRRNPGKSWWNIGRPDAVTPDGHVQSNSAHLYVLVREGYATPEDLLCPGNPVGTGGATRDMHDWPIAKAVSFSYQNQHTARPIRLDEAGDTLAILADKNPLFVINKLGRIEFSPHCPKARPSRSHDGRGQNLLTADGSAMWTHRPIVLRPGSEGADNVWIVTGISAYDGTQHPLNGERDSFLVP